MREIQKSQAATTHVGQQLNNKPLDSQKAVKKIAEADAASASKKRLDHDSVEISEEGREKAKTAAALKDGLKEVEIAKASQDSEEAQPAKTVADISKASPIQVPFASAGLLAVSRDQHLQGSSSLQNREIDIRETLSLDNESLQQPTASDRSSVEAEVLRAKESGAITSTKQLDEAAAIARSHFQAQAEEVVNQKAVESDADVLA